MKVCRSGGFVVHDVFKARVRKSIDQLFISSFFVTNDKNNFYIPLMKLWCLCPIPTKQSEGLLCDDGSHSLLFFFVFVASLSLGAKLSDAVDSVRC